MDIVSEASEQQRPEAENHQRLKNECLSSAANADVGFIPFLICLLIEGSLPTLVVGAFLLI